jgi:hypothetical protein
MAIILLTLRRNMYDVAIDVAKAQKLFSELLGR